VYLHAVQLCIIRTSYRISSPFFRSAPKRWPECLNIVPLPTTCEALTEASLARLPGVDGVDSWRYVGHGVHPSSPLVSAPPQVAPPQGAPAGGMWIEENYRGTMSCLACLFVPLCGMCVMCCCPLDKRTVRVGILVVSFSKFEELFAPDLSLSWSFCSIFPEPCVFGYVLKKVLGHAISYLPQMILLVSLCSCLEINRL